MKTKISHSHPDITNDDILSALTSGTSKIRIDFISDDNSIQNSVLLSQEEVIKLQKQLSYSINIHKADRKRFGYN